MAGNRYVGEAMNSALEALRIVPQLLIALALFIVAVRGFRRLEARMGNIHIDVEQVGHTADAVNRAVNNVGDGEPTLRNVVVQMSHKLEAHVIESNSRLDRIEEHLTKPPAKRSRA